MTEDERKDKRIAQLESEKTILLESLRKALEDLDRLQYFLSQTRKEIATW